MTTNKKRKAQKFGGHSQAQVIDTIIGCKGYGGSGARIKGAQEVKPLSS